ncbi:hypothetical protein ZEAMMB73_Zm00001d050049 [Zea mays]|nr:hypothetical protein ZEAMMB73_Zm00001d050049 [Zea mays]
MIQDKYCLRGAEWGSGTAPRRACQTRREEGLHFGAQEES